jgi:hypothetical protein
MTQGDLGKLFKEDGLHKHDPGRIVRGTKEMQKAHMDAFKRHLRMPDAWWEEADLDALLGVATPRPGDGEDEGPRLDEQLRGGEGEASSAEAPDQTQKPDRAQRS